MAGFLNLTSDLRRTGITCDAYSGNAWISHCPEANSANENCAAAATVPRWLVYFSSSDNSNKNSEVLSEIASNLAKGIQSGDFKITEDETGNKEVIRTAPSVLQAIGDGWQGYFESIKDAAIFYNPFVSEEEKIQRMASAYPCFRPGKMLKERVNDTD